MVVNGVQKVMATAESAVTAAAEKVSQHQQHQQHQQQEKAAEVGHHTRPRCLWKAEVMVNDDARQATAEVATEGVTAAVEASSAEAIAGRRLRRVLTAHQLPQRPA